MDEISTIVLIRSGAIGDFIVTLPAIQLLRRSHPGARLVLVARNRVRSLVKNLVDEFLDIDGPLLLPFFHEKVDQLCREYEYLNAFDLVISYLGSDGPVSNNLRALTRPHVVNANPLPPPDYNRHITEFLLSPLAELVDVSSPPVPTVTIDERETAKADKFLKSCGISESTHVVAAHPGSGGRQKVSPPSNLARAVNWIQEAFPRTRVLAIEGEADEQDVLAFKRELGDLCVIVKKQNLAEVAAILRRASLFLGNDSGIAHLAAAVGTPAVVVFRASNPAVWAPRGKRVWVATDASVQKTVRLVAAKVLSRKRSNPTGARI